MIIFTTGPNGDSPEEEGKREERQTENERVVLLIEAVGQYLHTNYMAF